MEKRARLRYYKLIMKKISAIGFDWGGVILQTPGRSFADDAAQFFR